MVISSHSGARSSVQQGCDADAITRMSQNVLRPPKWRFQITKADTQDQFFVNLQITNQARVTILENMQPSEILQLATSSLERTLVQSPQLRQNLQISTADLLASGDVRVLLKSTTPTVPLSSNDFNAWHQEIQRALAVRQNLYKVWTEHALLKDIEIGSRLQKAASIKQIIDANLQQSPSRPTLDGLVDIEWWKASPSDTEPAVLLSFSNPQQANQILDHGIHWQGMSYICKPLEGGTETIRCKRCQSYGHSKVSCRAPIKCGICSELHETKGCVSKSRKCANCGWPYVASHKRCPVKRSWLNERGPFGFQESPAANDREDRIPANTTRLDPTPPRLDHTGTVDAVNCSQELSSGPSFEPAVKIESDYLDALSERRITSSLDNTELLLRKTGHQNLEHTHVEHLGKHAPTSGALQNQVINLKAKVERFIGLLTPTSLGRKRPHSLTLWRGTLLHLETPDSPDKKRIRRQAPTRPRYPDSYRPHYPDSYRRHYPDLYRPRYSRLYRPRYIDSYRPHYADSCQWRYPDLYRPRYPTLMPPGTESRQFFLRTVPR